MNLEEINLQIKSSSEKYRRLLKEEGAEKHRRISLFCRCGKCEGMPVNKGLNSGLGVWKTLEVRYQVPKKMDFGSVCCIFALTYKQGPMNLFDEKTNISVIIYSAFFAML